MSGHTPRTPGERVVLCQHWHPDRDCTYRLPCYTDLPATYLGPVPADTMEDTIGYRVDAFRLDHSSERYTLSNRLDGPYQELIRRPDEPSLVGRLGWPYSAGEE